MERFVPHFQGIPGQVLEKASLSVPRPSNSQRWGCDCSLWGRVWGGGEGAKLADVYPTSFAEHFKSAEHRRSSFVLAVHTAFGLLSSPLSQARRVKTQNATASKPWSPPGGGSLRDSAGYFMHMHAGLWERPFATAAKFVIVLIIKEYLSRSFCSRPGA